jgi:glyoxylate/hydroxypyruvate reductase
MRFGRYRIVELMNSSSAALIPALTIVVVNPNLKRSRWVEPITAALPHHRVIDSRDPSEVDVAMIGWMGDTDLRRYANLRFMQSLWMGVDRLMNNPAVPDGIPLARMVDPGMPQSMTETVLAHVLSAHRQLDVYARYQRDQLWRTHRQPLATERTVGVLGLGELGSRAAQTLRSLGFRVVGWSRRGEPLSGVEVSTDLAWVLGQSEILVNLLPLTNATIGLLSRSAFDLFPKQSVLINVARGAHIVDEDLLAALASGQLRHAFLDVFNTEPLPPEHPYWTHKHITATPHVAADSEPKTCVPIIMENVRRLMCNEPLLNLVDRDLGY